MEQTTDILVIGGGVMGLASAWKLAREGHKVTLMTVGKCGEGASLASLGVLMPYAPWMTSENALNQTASLWAYPEFAQELLFETGMDIGYKRMGRIQHLASEHARQQYIDYLSFPNENWGPKDLATPQSYLTPDETEKRFPELEQAEFGTVLCKATARVDVARMVATLRSACLKNGVDLREDCPVTKLRYENNAVSFAQTAHGKLVAKKYVLAAGAWSQKLLPETMQNEQWVKPLKGQALLLKGEERLIHHIIRAKGLYIVPLENNQFYVGATKEEKAGFDDSITEEAQDKILSKAESLLPALAETKIMKQWCGFRPQAGKVGAQVNWCADAENLLMVFGHGGIGICMTPWVSTEVVKKFQ